MSTLASSHECDDCGMDFETKNELTNHKKRFCNNSHYGTEATLEKRMSQLKNLNNDYDLPNY